uniref:Uncharacterized protein n=1 Tax=Panagrolaimus davidi TaxID=227884 RepID=A0A914P839_9BILA
MCQNLEESEETEEYLENYKIYAKESGEKHLTTIEAKYEIIQNDYLEILKIVKKEVAAVEQFSALVSSYENKMKSLLHSYQTEYSIHNEENSKMFDQLSSVVTDKCENVNTNIENTVEVCGKKNTEMIKKHENLADSISTIMDANLTTSQKDMERFIHHEVLRYSSGGDTPQRKKRHFCDEITSIPSVQKLLNQFATNESPLRQ